ncbi:hypothetical protein SAMN02745121_04834 [Nannocystis exedens]|uniref:Uncharacterized protein n=1 Tax=Nannocystis exedens TaxID=54 RepID=A0A1I2BWX1_9BACT|nr:hypothetical protein [Nannocystis exedens]PCC71202.1 hypothetical protein NAEX_04276 [Nannocystis exedens]SFE60666.1 hypothetical protein SAMN02745121_04834 [Nannocystis exedens]
MRLVAPVLAATLAACGDLPEPQMFGAHVVIAADPGLEPCGGTLVHLDEFVARLADVLSVDPPTGDDRFLVYWLAREDFHARSGCPEGALACASGDRTSTPVLPLNHELVHNLAATMGPTLPLFAEGLATAFEGLGDEVDHDMWPHGAVHDVLGLLTGTQLGQANGYSLAGAFTTFLIERHGIDAYLRMYEAVGPLETARGVDRIFREEFGVSFDDSVAEFAALDAPDCGKLERDAKVLECAAPELEWSVGRFVHHRSMACEQDDVVGPYAGDDALVFHTITVPADGDYLVTVLGDDPNNRISLQPCTLCGSQGVTIPAGQPPFTVALAAGRYSLRLHGPARARTSLGVRIEPADASAP